MSSAGYLVICSVLLLGGVARGLELDDCLAKDSITCVQGALFRKAKAFFEQDKIELWGGLALSKNPGEEGHREDRGLEDPVAAASTVEEKTEALESFTLGRAARLLEDRSLTWNLSPLVAEVRNTARSISEAIPTDLKESVTNFINEGRGKKKKILKALLPVLLGIKLKVAGLLVLAYLGIALLAKKALLVSLISLAISGFIAIKKLLSQHQQHHHPEVHEVSHGWAGPSYGGGYSSGGWDSYSGGGGHDPHGAYSSNVPHTLAYSGQKPSSRR